ncbi:MAG: hypothetical protein II029_06210 [Bacteroidales bacterium]|nr:hypothetical protein [Bacteroidales bacterium]
MDITLFSKIIRDLILDNDEVNLPGLGTFVSESMPSTFSDKGYTINPPYRRLVFRQRKGDGRLLVEHCSKVLGESLERTEYELEGFISELRNTLESKKVAVFPGLGRLRATRENAFFFIADEDLEIYKYGFGLEPVSLKTHEETPEEVSAAVDELEKIVRTEPEEVSGSAPDPSVPPVAAEVPVPEPVAEVPGPEPEPAEEVPGQASAAVASGPGPVGDVPPPSVGPASSKAPTQRRRTSRNPWKTAWIILACTIATAVLLLAAFIILSRVAPGFVDSLLYSPEELQIINHLQDIPESSLNQ